MKTTVQSSTLPPVMVGRAVMIESIIIIGL